MARRYVRDKLGRFAPKGGGGKRAGKLSKATGSGRSFKSGYKSAKSGLRFEKRVQAEFGANKREVTKAKKSVTMLKTAFTKKGKAAGSGIKKGLSAQAASRRRRSFSSKTTRGRAAKAEFKAARRADRTGPLGEGRARDRNQKRVIKKQTGKTTYAQGYRETPAKTKARRPGAKTKAQKIRAKIELKKSYNKMERGSEFKGKKKGTAKQLAAGKKRSAAAKAKKKAAKAPSQFSGTKKYSRQGKVSKASGKGRLAKAKYKSAKSKARQTKRHLAVAKESRVEATKMKKDWRTKERMAKVDAAVKRKTTAERSARSQLTRVTNKMTAKGAAKAKNKKTMGKKLTKSQLRMKAMARKERLGTRPKKKLTGKTAPRKGETARQYKARLKRSGPMSVRRAFQEERMAGGDRGSWYRVPGTRVGGKQTRKSINRAKNRDFWSPGGKRSTSITKSKRRHRDKLKKRKRK
jgi:hypothetical protein